MSLIRPEDEPPKCPKCNIRAIALYKIPIEGKIKLVCRSCKREWVKKSSMPIETLNKIIATIEKRQILE